MIARLQYLGKRGDSMFEYDGITFEARINESEFKTGTPYRGWMKPMVYEKLAMCCFGSGSWYCFYKGRQWFEVISVIPEEVSCI